MEETYLTVCRECSDPSFATSILSRTGVVHLASFIMRVLFKVKKAAHAAAGDSIQDGDARGLGEYDGGNVGKQFALELQT